MRLLLLLAYLGITTAYLLCAWEHWGTPPPGVSSFLREQVNTNHENSFIELFSAAAWLIATVLFARAFVSARKTFSNHWSRIWLIFFSILCVRRSVKKSVGVLIGPGRIHSRTTSTRNGVSTISAWAV